MGDTLDYSGNKLDVFIEKRKARAPFGTLTPPSLMSLPSDPDEVRHEDGKDFLSNANRDSPNYAALKRQAAEAMEKPDAAVCIREQPSRDTVKVIVAGGSASENKRVASNEVGRFPGIRESCGPAKDFLKP